MPRLCVFLKFGSCLLLCAFLSLFVGRLDAAGKPYTPQHPDPFDEAWRWNRVEAFSGYRLHCVDEGEDGRHWFGTSAGVVVYDGFEIKQVLEEESIKDVAVFGRDVYVLSINGFWHFDGNSWKQLIERRFNRRVQNSIVRTIDGTVWVGTDKGLLRVVGDDVKPVEGFGRSILSLLIDDHGRLWIAQGGGGRVVVTDVEDGRLASRKSHRQVLDAMPGGTRFNIHHITKGHDGRVWVASAGREYAVRWFDEDLNEHLVEASRGIEFRDSLLALAVTVDGTVWMRDRTDLFSIHDGVWRTHDWKTEHFGRSLSKVGLLHSNSEGKLIVGGDSSPLFVINMAQDRWSSYHDLMFQCEDSDGNRWYIASGGELVFENLDTGEWTEYSKEDGVIDLPLVVFCDSRNTVWVAGAHEGQAAVGWKRRNQWNVDLYPELGSMISHLSAFENKLGQMLFGSGHELTAPSPDKRGGLVKYRSVDNGYRAEVIPAKAFVNRVVSIVEDRVGDLYTGGRYLYRHRKGELERIELPVEDNSRWIDHIVLDSQNQIWSAVYGKGIFRLNGDQVDLFNEESGLASESVANLALDQQGHLLAGTSMGISRFDGVTWTTHVLPEELGFDREAGTLRAAKDGAIWVNIATRSWFFRGSEYNPMPKNRVYENMSVRFKGNANGPETTLHSKDIELHEPGNVKLEWSGKDFWNETPEDDLEFSYRVDAGEWTAFAKEKETFLLELATGSHVVEVRSRDLDGNVDESPARVSIAVVPALWKRPWFIATEVAVVLLIAGLIYAMIRMRMRHMMESRDFKLWFFTQISHELKTPLSLILGPVESTLKRASDSKTKGSMEIASRNARKMLSLVNQLLEFQKVEMGGVRVEASRVDLVGFVGDSIPTYRAMADQKAQDLIFECEKESWIAFLDTDKLQKILDNLVSNAVKYTPDCGTIKIRLEVDAGARASSGEIGVIRVEDTGLGIPTKDQNRIFDPYYRVGGKSKQAAKGTGIGLALVNELVRVCRGTIEVESPINGEGGGTRFTVRLPSIEAEEDLKQHEEPELDAGASEEADEKLEPDAQVEEKASQVSRGNKPLVLLVDDNPDIRSFLSEELGEEFATIEAKDGREGLEVARKESPDLIVTDVMMPEMDGHEFCRHIKTERLTSHIPVIMLTAKSSLQSHIHGLELGADDYLSKPVETELLVLRIRNLLASRQALRERFVQQQVLTPKEVTATSLDEKLLEKAIGIVEDHMQDFEFSVELLAEALHMSRVTLYRKLKALIGQTPSDFIATIRLKRATQLMKNNSFSVIEISNLVGFNDSNYFSNRFKREYGMTPTQYMAKEGKRPTST
ncbi:response regulator [Pelagicoccus mobilis]|uniref:histidine kinase n=1 Tax=Pelagicoccus mobilis TaxID=415221 RepID=A0A934RZ41_9BACT|nr:response regulator [Pelagicoccus mobilis]MBK1876972.1 response regulator [Pelagicoccus mobilis]